MKVLQITRQVLPVQLKLLEETAPFILVTGGARSGKTRGGALKALKLCAEYPGIVGMVTAPSHNILTSATVPTYKEIFTKDLWLSFNETKLIAEIYGGGRIYFRTTADPYLLRGVGLGFFHMDEGADSSLLAFRILQARLSQPDTPRQGWITTTPLGFNWLYQEFVKEKRDNYVRIKADTKDNWFLPADFVAKLEESYQDKQFLLQELEGEFIEIGETCPFDMEALNSMYQDTKDKEEIRNEMGFIRVFSERQVGKRYVLAADAATGLGEDESTFICAIATPAGIEEVCSGKGKMPEAEFADILNMKSTTYNKALTIVEDAPVGKATLTKLNELHTNVYKRKGDKAGYPTLSTTKPMMIAELGDAIRDRALTIHNLDIIEQLMSYARDAKGKYGAVSGARDDYVSALMLLIQGTKVLPMNAKIIVSYPTTIRTVK